MTRQWKLERAALGEGPPEDVPAEELEALRRSNEEILARYPAAGVEAEVRRRVERAVTPSSRRAVAVRAWVAVAAMLVVAVVFRAQRTERGSEEEVTRLKGSGPSLRLHRRGDGGVERLKNGATARRGDLLQLAYLSAGRRYGAILSWDGGKSVTRHFPLQGSTAAPLQGEGESALPTAYELDDAPRFERFVLLTSERPFELEPLLRAAREVAEAPAADEAELPVPAGVEQVTVVLRKAK